MSILSELDLENIPNTSAVDAGEYEVAILSAEDYIGQTSGKPSIKIMLDIPGEAMADPIFHYLSLPNPDEEPKKNLRKLQRIKQFLTAFDIDKGLDYMEWQGRKAWALVALENDQNGEPRNSIKRFLGSSGHSGGFGETKPSEAVDIPF